LPRIDWMALPPAIREHLRVRTRERELSKSDLAALLAWIKTDPEVPDGPWWKDFGSKLLWPSWIRGVSRHSARGLAEAPRRQTRVSTPD